MPNNPNWGIDNKTSAVVRQIFHMAMMNMTDYAIAGKLNSEGIPAANSKHWTTGGVLRILRNESYVGTFITGKTRNEITDRIRVVPVAADKWIRHVRHHMPIIDETTFYAVQDMLNTRNSPFKKGVVSEDFFCGKLFCNLCGSKMRRKKSNNGSFYYMCSKRSDTKNVCTNQSKREAKIKRYVFEIVAKKILEVREYRDRMVDFEQSHYYKNLEYERNSTLDNLNTQLKYHENLFQEIYEESVSSKSWNSSDSRGLMVYLREVRNNLHERIDDIMSTREAYQKNESSTLEKVQRYLQFEGSDSLTEGIVELFVEKILVKPDGIEVEFVK